MTEPTPAHTQARLMRPQRPVGIVGYGAYVPRYRLPADEVTRIWGGEGPVSAKAVAGPDEDTITMSIEASRNAMARARIPAHALRAVWIGSESHPYAVKPSSTVVAEALGATPEILAADLQFACKAGTEALQAAMALVGSGMGDYGLAIGADTAQGRPGDALEFTAGAGAAAFVMGPADVSLAVLEASYSFVTDTPDFWRRPREHYPQHAGRFTGEPAYYRHSLQAAKGLMESLGIQATDVDYAVFHQPNPRFPTRAARSLGFTREQIAPGLLVDRIGNAYAGSSLLGLAAVLDACEPGKQILHVSFGSGAGSDAFLWRTTDILPRRQELATTTLAYIARSKNVDYGLYARYRSKLRMH